VAAERGVRAGEHLPRPGDVERLHAVEGETPHRSAPGRRSSARRRGGHGSRMRQLADGVNATYPTDSDIASARPRAGTIRDVDIRIGVTQAPRELTLDVDDAERDSIKAAIVAALACATDVLWLTDKRGKQLGVPAAKIAYVE